MTKLAATTGKVKQKRSSANNKDHAVKDASLHEAQILAGLAALNTQPQIDSLKDESSAKAKLSSKKLKKSLTENTDETDLTQANTQADENHVAHNQSDSYDAELASIGAQWSQNGTANLTSLSAEASSNAKALPEWLWIGTGAAVVGGAIWALTDGGSNHSDPHHCGFDTVFSEFCSMSGSWAPASIATTENVTININNGFDTSFLPTNPSDLTADDLTTLFDPYFYSSSGYSGLNVDAAGLSVTLEEGAKANVNVFNVEDSAIWMKTLEIQTATNANAYSAYGAVDLLASGYDNSTTQIGICDLNVSIDASQYAFAGLTVSANGYGSDNSEAAIQLCDVTINATTSSTDIDSISSAYVQRVGAYSSNGSAQAAVLIDELHVEAQAENRALAYVNDISSYASENSTAEVIINELSVTSNGLNSVAAVAGITAYASRDGVLGNPHATLEIGSLNVSATAVDNATAYVAQHDNDIHDIGIAAYSEQHGESDVTVGSINITSQTQTGESIAYLDHLNATAYTSGNSSLTIDSIQIETTTTAGETNSATSYAVLDGVEAFSFDGGRAEVHIGSVEVNANFDLESNHTGYSSNTSYAGLWTGVKAHSGDHSSESTVTVDSIALNAKADSAYAVAFFSSVEAQANAEGTSNIVIGSISETAESNFDSKAVLEHIASGSDGQDATTSIQIDSITLNAASTESGDAVAGIGDWGRNSISAYVNGYADNSDSTVDIGSIQINASAVDGDASAGVDNQIHAQEDTLDYASQNNNHMSVSVDDISISASSDTGSASSYLGSYLDYNPAAIEASFTNYADDQTTTGSVAVATIGNISIESDVNGGNAAATSSVAGVQTNITLVGYDLAGVVSSDATATVQDILIAANNDGEGNAMAFMGGNTGYARTNYGEDSVSANIHVRHDNETNNHSELSVESSTVHTAVADVTIEATANQGDALAAMRNIRTSFSAYADIGYNLVSNMYASNTEQTTDVGAVDINTSTDGTFSNAVLTGVSTNLSVSGYMNDWVGVRVFDFYSDHQTLDTSVQSINITAETTGVASTATSYAIAALGDVNSQINLSAYAQTGYADDSYYYDSNAIINIDTLNATSTTNLGNVNLTANSSGYAVAHLGNLNSVIDANAEAYDWGSEYGADIHMNLSGSVSETNIGDVSLSANTTSYDAASTLDGIYAGVQLDALAGGYGDDATSHLTAYAVSSSVNAGDISLVATSDEGYVEASINDIRSSVDISVVERTSGAETWLSAVSNYAQISTGDISLIATSNSGYARAEIDQISATNYTSSYGDDPYVNVDANIASVDIKSITLLSSSLNSAAFSSINSISSYAAGVNGNTNYAITHVGDVTITSTSTEGDVSAELNEVSASSYDGYAQTTVGNINIEAVSVNGSAYAYANVWARSDGDIDSAAVTSTGDINISAIGSSSASAYLSVTAWGGSAYASVDTGDITVTSNDYAELYIDNFDNSNAFVTTGDITLNALGDSSYAYLSVNDNNGTDINAGADIGDLFLNAESASSGIEANLNAVNWDSTRVATLEGDGEITLNVSLGDTENQLIFAGIDLTHLDGSANINFGNFGLDSQIWDAGSDSYYLNYTTLYGFDSTNDSIRFGGDEWTMNAADTYDLGETYTNADSLFADLYDVMDTGAPGQAGTEHFVYAQFDEATAEFDINHDGNLESSLGVVAYDNQQIDNSGGVSSLFFVSDMTTYRMDEVIDPIV